jgi:type I restriction enzyme R subunit
METVSGKMEHQQRRTTKPRILFLADRNILADQAFNAFSVFEEDALVRINPSDIKKKGRVPKNGSVFFTISKPL